MKFGREIFHFRGQRESAQELVGKKIRFNQIIFFPTKCEEMKINRENKFKPIEEKNESPNKL